MTLERRQALEVRAAGRRLEGYAAVFDREARVADFVEVVRPGAFRASLAAGRDVLCLVDHDQSRLLGRTSSGTLSLAEDDKGLRFAVELPDTAAGRDVAELAARGDLGGCSFGFVATGEYWVGRRRELRAVNLAEISVITAWPAYAGTSVALRTKPVARLRLAEAWLRSC